MFSPLSMFQWMGVGALASTPLAAGPRNWGQSEAVAEPAQRTARRTAVARVSLMDERKQKTSHIVKRAEAVSLPASSFFPAAGLIWFDLV
jgi:hypothetical protein